MYNIKQAAARAGVTVPVLRAWERRYGIVAPGRTVSGYRQFDDASIARVRAMRELVEEGWSPSAAAAAIVAGDVAGPPRPLAELPPGTSQVATAELPADGLVDAARRLDPVAAERALDDAFARGSFERVMDQSVFPSLRRLGEAWAAGDVSVAGEHLASHAVLRRLAQALDAAGAAVDPAGATGERRGHVVVGLAPGGRHELAALGFAVAARRAGLPVAYLGPDLPVDDWVVASEHAAAAVIGVLTPRDRRPATEVAARLRAARPGLVVAFGGRAAPDRPGVLTLVGTLDDSVNQLRDALIRGAARR